VLVNLLASDRHDFLLGVFTQSGEERRVFSRAEAGFLAPILSKALSQATPGQVVTFHWRQPDASRVAVVTSGGLFVEGPRLVVILANERSRPTLSYEGITSENDSKEAPLLPFRPRAIRLGFRDLSLRAPLDLVAGRYLFDDEALAVAVDLERLALVAGDEGGDGTAERKAPPN
jgi:hypothetical protein